MLSQMVNINRASRAAHILLQTQKGLAQVNKTGSTVGVRVRGYLQNDKTSVKELVEVYHHLAEQTSQSSLFSLTEEKLLNILTEEITDDDIVSRYLPKISPYDYSSLCHLFIEIASVGRRPTPLIKAASNTLSRLPLPDEHETKPKISTLITTLNALVKLNYINRSLVSKIINDITTMINLKEVDIATQCSLLRSLAGLKWRHEPLMQLFYDYVSANHQDSKKVNHNLILTLLYVTATINYQPKESIEQFYNNYMAGSREDCIDRKTRKWLNLVWSLAVLGIGSEHHFESVLDDEFIAAIENPLGLQRFNHADVMKLLNIRAIAKLEKHLYGTRSRLLDDLAEQKIQRGSDMQKFASKAKNALIGLANSERELRHEIHTPYGFVVDCEVMLNEEMKFIPLDDRTTLEDELNLAETMTRTCDTRERKFAIIYVLFDEAIANHPEEPVGHKKIISRILQNAGYRTIFLQEGILNREKTSSDLADKIRQTIMTSYTD